MQEERYAWSFKIKQAFWSKSELSLTGSCERHVTRCQPMAHNCRQFKGKEITATLMFTHENYYYTKILIRKRSKKV